MKKILAAVMTAVILCTLCACGAKEATPFQMKQEKGDHGYTCEGFKKQSTLEEFEIPGAYNGKAVQCVGSSAFAESDVVRLTIAEGVEVIDSYAFRDCSKLESIRLPESLKKIDMSAFCGCTALKEIYIPAGVTELEMWAFADCSALETVVIEGRLDTLGQESFRDCPRLKVLYLPETLTKIDPNALDGCDSLEEIHFAGTAEEFLNIDFTWDWMSAENVLVCCADNDILMEDKNTWDYSDQWVLYPRDPMEALSGNYVSTGVSSSGETEDRSDSVPDETPPEAWDSSVPRMAHGYVEFTSDYVASDIDEFARCFAQCDFAAAANYLNSDLRSALNGDVTREIDSETMEHFGSGAIGYDPYSTVVNGSENFEMTLWKVKMDRLRDHHEELGIKIGFDNDRVKEYYYNFGTIYNIEGIGWEKYATLTVYAVGSEIVAFSYAGTN